MMRLIVFIALCFCVCESVDSQTQFSITVKLLSTDCINCSLALSDLLNAEHVNVDSILVDNRSLKRHISKTIPDDNIYYLEDLGDIQLSIIEVRYKNKVIKSLPLLKMKEKDISFLQSLEITKSPIFFKSIVDTSIFSKEYKFSIFNNRIAVNPDYSSSIYYNTSNKESFGDDSFTQYNLHVDSTAYAKHLNLVYDKRKDISYSYDAVIDFCESNALPVVEVVGFNISQSNLNALYTLPAIIDNSVQKFLFYKKVDLGNQKIIEFRHFDSGTDSMIFFLTKVPSNLDGSRIVDYVRVKEEGNMTQRLTVRDPDSLYLNKTFRHQEELTRLIDNPELYFHERSTSYFYFNDSLYAYNRILDHVINLESMTFQHDTIFASNFDFNSSSTPLFGLSSYEDYLYLYYFKKIDSIDYVCLKFDVFDIDTNKKVRSHILYKDGNVNHIRFCQNKCYMVWKDEENNRLNFIKYEL